ncbi:MAG: thiol reductant ABC exporter subunit CydD, partial [Anaerolineales bacterium]|nr:thiol reductant ABC exporter subunit CydD [Anaerolineales bacterium]
KEIALKVKSSLRDKIYAHILKLGPVNIRGERTGELVNLATEGVQSLDAYFSQYLPQLVLAALVPATYLAAVFPVDVLSGLVLLFTAPLIPVFMVLIGSLTDRVTRQQWQTLSRLSAHFLDVVQGLTTLKAFGRSRDQIRMIREISERYRETTMDILRVAFLSALVLELVATISTALVAVEIGLRLLSGQMGFRHALFVLLLAPEFYYPLRMLGARFHAGVTGITAASRIFEFLDQPLPREAQEDEPVDLSSPPCELALFFDQVSFQHADGGKALDGISFSVAPGDVIALVGPSGAGKTTIAHLLLGFIQPTEGRIHRKKMELTWVPQNPYLFNDTIAANICLSPQEANQEEIIAAAKAAHIHDFITSLPQGYQTVVGERGARLSGGQAQRIALARAFLRGGSLIVLDEPTAHLDPGLESRLQESIAEVLKGRTAVIIAHRLNTVVRADTILVLDEGRLVQSGRHDELFEREGLYRSLWQNTASRTKKHDVHPEAVYISDHLPKAYPSLETDPPPTSPEGSSILGLLHYISPLKGWVLLSVLLGFATISSGVGLMGTSAYIISAAALQPSIAELQLAIVGVRFFGLSRGVFRYLERYVSHQTTFRVIANMRSTFFARLERLAPSRLSA